MGLGPQSGGSMPGADPVAPVNGRIVLCCAETGEGSSVRMASGSREAVPPGIDVSRPHSARMYDYFLGGKDNFAIDRKTAEAALQSLPTLRTGVRENRRFLAR